MNNLFSVVIINLLLFHLPTAQINWAAPQGDNAKSQELAEASQLSQQVVKFYNEKKFDEAIPVARRALEIRERVLGKDDALVGEAVQNLASLYFGKNDHGEALGLYKRALSIFEKAHGPESIKLTKTLDVLAWLYYADGNASKAEDVFRRAVEIREKALGPDHELTGRAAHTLAQFYQRQGSYGKAVNYYKRAVQAKEKASPNDEQLADLMDKCACAMLQARQTKEASELQKRAYSIRKKEPFPEDLVQGSVLQGKATFRAEPVYPSEARRRGIAGAVVVEVTVDETGKVIDAKAMCGPDPLIPTTVEAARRWRFSPTLLSGQPVKVIGTISFYFSL
jgi:TonB family protein